MVTAPMGARTFSSFRRMPQPPAPVSLQSHVAFSSRMAKRGAGNAHAPLRTTAPVDQYYGVSEISVGALPGLRAGFGSGWLWYQALRRSMLNGREYAQSVITQKRKKT